jgi:regulator of extracellular matrix RemA (YlzA/DUF370 family)
VILSAIQAETVAQRFHSDGAPKTELNTREDDGNANFK